MCVLQAAFEQLLIQKPEATDVELCAAVLCAARADGRTICDFFPVNEQVRVAIAGEVDPVWLKRPKTPAS